MQPGALLCMDADARAGADLLLTDSHACTGMVAYVDLLQVQSMQHFLLLQARASPRALHIRSDLQQVIGPCRDSFTGRPLCSVPHRRAFTLACLLQSPCSSNRRQADAEQVHVHAMGQFTGRQAGMPAVGGGARFPPQVLDHGLQSVQSGIHH